MSKNSIHLKNLNQIIEIAEDVDKYFYWIPETDINIDDSKLVFLFQKPNIHSKIFFKIIIKDDVKFNLDAILKINKGAVGTETYLKIDILQLGSQNTSSCKIIPSLEIQENSVKAGHGASISRIDETQLYYMMSRGISRTDSEELIIKGFLS